MGCGESKAELHLTDKYRNQLKNPNVVAALESLQLDKNDVGLRFFKLFSAMDIDGSNSIDLDEFHVYFGLPRTIFSDQVFSALGKQSSARALTFDDFLLNLWNFCTMSSDDLYAHVFKIYDDDDSGTLDAAECDSLFRMLYNTNELPLEIKKMILDVDINGDGLLSLDEFSVMCHRNKNLLQPILQLQRKAQEKCFGIKFWSKETKRRSQILAAQSDIFSLVQQRLHPNDQQPHALLSASLLGSSNHPQRSTIVTSGSTAAGNAMKASERLAAKQKQQEMEELEAWARDLQQQQSEVREYLAAFTQKHVTDALLKKKSQETTPEAIKETAELRYNAAVHTKRFEAAKDSLTKAWKHEEAKVIQQRKDAVTKMANGASVNIGAVLQRKLEAAADDVRDQFEERWQKIERVAQLQADQALQNALTQQPKNQSITSLPKPASRVVPTNQTATWSQQYDANSGQIYYLSSSGQSTWEKPPGFIN